MNDIEEEDRIENSRLWEHEDDHLSTNRELKAVPRRPANQKESATKRTDQHLRTDQHHRSQHHSPKPSFHRHPEEEREGEGVEEASFNSTNTFVDLDRNQQQINRLDHELKRLERRVERLKLRRQQLNKNAMATGSSATSTASSALGKCDLATGICTGKLGADTETVHWDVKSIYNSPTHSVDEFGHRKGRAAKKSKGSKNSRKSEHRQKLNPGQLSPGNSNRSHHPAPGQPSSEFYMLPEKRSTSGEPPHWLAKSTNQGDANEFEGESGGFGSFIEGNKDVLVVAGIVAFVVACLAWLPSLASSSKGSRCRMCQGCQLRPGKDSGHNVPVPMNPDQPCPAYE